MDLAALLPSWEVALRADRRSPSTLESYLLGVRRYLDWCHTNGHPPELTKTLVRAWVADLLDNGAEPTTARARLMAVRRFSAWLTEEDEQDNDPLLGMRPPKVDTKVTPRLTDAQIVAMLKACSGKEFIDRRDEAVLRLLLETGMRAGELLGLALSDVDVSNGVAVIRRGKGGKGRTVPFGPQTARALDRYLRARRTHRLADSAAFWLGGGGQAFGYHGLDVALKRRATKAGIADFHIHLTRHTAAQRWLSAGGSEGGLMSVAGWSTRAMLDRYTAATAAERAAAEARGLNLGEL